MTNEILVVERLTVEVVTGRVEDDPYGQGFAGLAAEVPVRDARLAATLLRASRTRESVTLRCAMLDVTGRVTRAEPGDAGTTFRLAVDDLVFRKPTSDQLR